MFHRGLLVGLVDDLQKQTLDKAHCLTWDSHYYDKKQKQKIPDH